MSESTAKLIRKLFPDRRQYRWFKKKYRNSTLTQKAQVRAFARDIASSGKKVENITIN